MVRQPNLEEQIRLMRAMHDRLNRAAAGKRVYRREPQRFQAVEKLAMYAAPGRGAVYVPCGDPRVAGDREPHHIVVYYAE